MSLVTIARELRTALAALTFPKPIAYVYNPLEYAWQPHRRYLTRYGQGRREVLFVGMNPGPWGMTQTGVPFGDVLMVRDWLDINGEVGHPPREHPKRPVSGYACTRREPSGMRLWGWARERYHTPAHFFERHFVINYCPLCFFDEAGVNLTPDKLPVASRRPLLEVCDAALARSVEELQARYVLGVGRFAATRAALAVTDAQVKVDTVPHPSPANPAANRGWAALLEKKLHSLDII